MGNVDVFSEHRISETIKKDLERTLNSNQMNAFKSGLDFKSAKTRKIDEALVDLLVGKMQLYAKGWIQCNANKTGELWNKSMMLDDQITDFKKELLQMNESLNKIIIKTKDSLSKDQLQVLRDLELLSRKVNE